MSVAASLVIKFGEGADSSALVKMEWDELLNVDAAGEGKTQFSPGDKPFFYIHYDTAKLRIGRVAVTHGQVVRQNPVTRPRTQQMGFGEADDTVELEYIPDGPLSAEWYMAAGAAQIIKRTGRTVQAVGTPFPALADVSYQIAAQGYQLRTPLVDLAEGGSYPLIVYAWMEAAL